MLHGLYLSIVLKDFLDLRTHPPVTCAGGLDTLALIADRGQSERARTSAIKVRLYAYCIIKQGSVYSNRCKAVACHEVIEAVFNSEKSVESAVIHVCNLTSTKCKV